MGVHATAVTASQSVPAGHLSVQWPAVTTVACTPFRVHSTICTCCASFAVGCDWREAWKCWLRDLGMTQTTTTAFSSTQLLFLLPWFNVAFFAAMLLVIHSP